MNPVKKETKYVWVDKDGQAISPIHEKLHSALNFIRFWDERFDRLVEKWGSWEQAPRHAREAMTKTGGKPHQLRRRIIVTNDEELTEDEKRLVETFRGSTP